MSAENQQNILHSHKYAELGLNTDGLEMRVPTGTDFELALWVSELTRLSETMLPKSVDEVLTMFVEGRSLVISDQDGQPLAHSAITFLYSDARMVEVGGAIVAPEKRRKGFGTIAALAVTELAHEKFPGWKVMVLCNAASLPIFLRLGGKVVGFEDLDQIPTEAWEACLICPNYQKTKEAGKICCDTPVLMPV